MEMAKRSHVLAIPYPTQGHVNPMLQFCKRLVSKGVKSTFAITAFISASFKPQSRFVQFDTFSDGCDAGGFAELGDVQAYLTRLELVGSETLADLIRRHQSSADPISCVVYDSFIPWVLDVAKQFGLASASFFTQPCAVNYIYYLVHHGLLKLPITSLPVSVPGLPSLELADMPAFIYIQGSYLAYFHMVLQQFSNVEKADYVLVNTFYKLEDEALDTMGKTSRLMTIGPTIPSSFLDNRLPDDTDYGLKHVPDDTDYGLNLFHSNPAFCLEWLSHKPPKSVVYVSFGSLSNLTAQQMEEMAWGLIRTNFFLLWVVRASERAKLRQDLVLEIQSHRGLIVDWGPQLQVLASEAVGCFFSHCGWNSTVEALSLGVPMVAMPQWTDQTTNAKLVQDVWKVGIRVKVDENGMVGREEIEGCVREVMEGEGGKEMKKRAMEWRELAKEAVAEGGTTDKCIDEFVSKLSP